MDKLLVLKSLGLNDNEAKTYLAILELGNSTVKPIADKAGIKRTSIYNFIDHLVELGIITQSIKNNKTYYQAQDPTRLANLQRQRLASVEQAMPEFMVLFNAVNTKPKIEYFEGPKQMQNIEKEILSCKREVLYIWPGQDIIDMVGGTKHLEELDILRKDKGIYIRAIRWKDKDATFSSSKGGTKFMRELRFAPPEIKVSMGIAIYDSGKVAFISSKNEGFGIMIQSEELMELITVYYKLLWEKSTPAKPSEG